MNPKEFTQHSPGAEEAALLALTLFDDLLGLLRERGVLTPHDITSLLKSAAHRLSESPNALAKRGARFIRNAMLPEHQAD